MTATSSLLMKISWRVTVVQNLNLSQLLTNGQILNTRAFTLCQEKNDISLKNFSPIPVIENMHLDSIG